MSKRFLRRLKRLSTYWLIRIIIATLCLLPRWLGSRVGALTGAACYYLFPKSRRIAIANLRAVYRDKIPEARIRAVARRCFANLGRFLFDVIKVQKKGMVYLGKITTVVGKENLDEALSKKRGVIALTAHVGNWELLGAYFSMLGYSVNVVASTQPDKRLHKLVSSMRRRVGLKVMDRSKGLLQAVRCLERGEIVGVLIDRDTRARSVIVDFLGIPARTAIGPVWLAKRTGAIVVPLAMLMDENGNYRIEVRRPIEVDGDSLPIDEGVKRCSKEVEELIRRDPTQWLWLQKRWKSVSVDHYR